MGGWLAGRAVSQGGGGGATFWVVWARSMAWLVRAMVGRVHSFIHSARREEEAHLAHMEAHGVGGGASGAVLVEGGDG